MDYKTWEPLLGKAAEDPAVKKALAEAKITSVKLPPLAKTKGAADAEPGFKTTFAVQYDIPAAGMKIGFHHESAIRPGGQQNKAVVSQISLVLHVNKFTEAGFSEYAGSLPYPIAKTDSREKVWETLGKPAYSMDAYSRDGWELKDRLLTVIYIKQFTVVKLLSFSLK